MNIQSTFLRISFWLNDYIKGSPIRKLYNEIKYLSENSFEKCIHIREQKLKKILHHAITNTEYYKGYSYNLNEFPIMNKYKYLENYNSIKVNIKHIPGQIGELHIQSTSGSTGTPFSIPQDTLKRQRRIAELKYFGKIVGFKTHDKLIHLRTWNKWQSKTQKQIRKENIIPFDISELGENKIKELCNLINKEKAICLRGYASSFNYLSHYAQKHSLNFPSLKIIIAGSEALHEDTRHNVKETFNCEIISQYANEECGILAQERIPTLEKDNPMYLNHASYFFEILKLDNDNPVEYGELGRIVITDLHNYAFPIIRYDTGDIGILLPPDNYSNGFPILGKLYGRRFDICYTTNNAPFFPMTIGRILKHYPEILQWQFIQKGAKNYLLKLILKKDIETNYINTIIPEDKTGISETDSNSMHASFPICSFNSRMMVFI